MDEVAEESISIKIRETCGSSLAVDLRVTCTRGIAEPGLNIGPGIVRSRERSNSPKKKFVNAWHQWMC